MTEVLSRCGSGLASSPPRRGVDARPCRGFHPRRARYPSGQRPSGPLHSPPGTIGAPCLGARRGKRFAAIAGAEQSTQTPPPGARAALFHRHYRSEQSRRSRWFRRAGKLFGRTGVKRTTATSGPPFWTACCLAGYVDTLSVIWAPRYAPEIVRCLKRVDGIDREYYFLADSRFVTQAYVKQPFLTDKFLRLAVPLSLPR